MKRAAWVLVLLVTGALSAVQIGLAHARNAMSQQTNVAGHQLRLVQLEVKRLNLEMASLSRPERLRALAKSKLGMAPPAARQVLHL